MARLGALRVLEEAGVPRVLAGAGPGDQGVHRSDPGEGAGVLAGELLDGAGVRGAPLRSEVAAG